MSCLVLKLKLDLLLWPKTEESAMTGCGQLCEPTKSHCKYLYVNQQTDCLQVKCKCTIDGLSLLCLASKKQGKTCYKIQHCDSFKLKNNQGQPIDLKI